MPLSHRWSNHEDADLTPTDLPYAPNSAMTRRTTDQRGVEGVHVERGFGATGILDEALAEGARKSLPVSGVAWTKRVTGLATYGTVQDGTGRGGGTRYTWRATRERGWPLARISSRLNQPKAVWSAV